MIKYCYSLITSIWIICTDAQKVAKMFQMLSGELPTHKMQNLDSLFVLIGYQKSLYSVTENESAANTYTIFFK